MVMGPFHRGVEAGRFSVGEESGDREGPRVGVEGSERDSSGEDGGRDERSTGVSAWTESPLDFPSELSASTVWTTAAMRAPATVMSAAMMVAGWSVQARLSAPG